MTRTYREFRKVVVSVTPYLERLKAITSPEAHWSTSSAELIRSDSIETLSQNIKVESVCVYAHTKLYNFKSKTTRSNKDKTQSKSKYFKIPTMSMRHEEKME